MRFYLNPKRGFESNILIIGSLKKNQNITILTTTLFRCCHHSHQIVY